MAAGARIKLAVPCQPDGFDPTLLSCAKKRGVEPPRRSCFRCAYRATEQKGCDPFDIPGVLISNCYPVERFYGFRQHSRSGLQLQTSLQLVQRSTCRAVNMAVPTAARHFCSAKILAGGLRWGWGPRRSRQRHRPRKEISRGNLLCAKSGLTNLSHPRLAVAQKYVTTPDWSHVRVGQPQGARGTAVPLFREESRGTPSKGFLWATSSRRLDTALLCADKKRGVETYQAGRALPVNPWSLDHRISKPRSIAPGLLRYSTVTLFARFLGLSISQPLCSAI